jgi:hypothetical protein
MSFGTSAAIAESGKGSSPTQKKVSTMKFSKLLVPAMLVISSHGFATERPNQLPSPELEGVTIQSINALGSGCKDPSTYAVNLSDDKKAFTLSFSEFIAEVGPGIPLVESRKNCSIVLDLKIPAGWQYTIGTFNYRGFMDLGPKVKAEHTTTYYFQGQGKTGSFTAVEIGPQAKDFVYTDKVGLQTAYIPDVWSPCSSASRALTINPSVRVSKAQGASSSAQGIITNDSVDGELTQVFGLQWRRCS